jgi:hypothetical protein
MRSVVIDVDIADVEPEDARQSGSSRVWNELTMRGSE